MGKRVYVAAPWLDRHHAEETANQLLHKGFVITHAWWMYEGESQEKKSDDFLRRCAELDVEGVKSADVILVLNTLKSEGKATEQGLAIAFGKPIVVVTKGVKPSSNIFHYLPNYTHVKTVDEAIGVLENG